MPDNIKERFVTGLKTQLQQTDLQGVVMPDVEAGQVGRRAGIIGAPPH